MKKSRLISMLMVMIMLVSLIIPSGIATEGEKAEAAAAPAAKAEMTAAVKSVSAAVGETAKLKVTVENAAGELTFQWYESEDGKKFVKSAEKGNKTKTLSVKVAESTFSKYYRCKVKDGKTTVNTKAVQIKNSKAKEAEEEKAKLERELAARDGASRREAEDMLRKARTTLEGARASVEYIFKELDEVKKSKDHADFASKYQSVKQDVRKRLGELDDEINPVAEADDADYVLPRELEPGDAVIHRTLGTEGTVVSLDGKGNATVQMGSMKSRIPIDKLRLADKQPEKKKDAASSYHAKLSRDFKATLDVRGLTGEDAWFLIDKYLDDAKVASVNSVTILHGKGTGALRKAIWGFLKSDSRVKSYRAGQYGEGDYGVTVVDLK